MRTLSQTPWDFATRPTVYRIGVPLRDDGRVPLVSIWIGAALTAFKSCSREAAREFGRNCEFFEFHSSPRN